MRLLFTAVPSYGHLLPLVPLMEAAREQGHEVVLATAAGFAEVVARELPAGVEHLAAGLLPHELVAEASRRTSADAMEPTARTAGEMFGAVPLDTAADVVLADVRVRAPDVVVSDVYDTVGALVAAVLGVPHHVVGLISEVRDDTAREIALSIRPHYAARAVAPARPTAYLDPCPPILRGARPDGVPVHPLRPHAHRRPAGVARADLPPFSDPSRPTALVTLGTVFADPVALNEIVGAVAGTGANVVATTGFSLRHGSRTAARAWSRSASGDVHTVEFAPLEDLLDGVSVVVGGGGSGTILGALCHGVPMVLLPQGADQPRNAARAAEAGVAVVVASPSEIAAAVADVLDGPTYARAAATAAAQIARMPDAHDVLRHVVLAT